MLNELALLGLLIGASAAPLMATSTTQSYIDVTNSSVVEDLRAFYGDKYPVNTISYLTPNTSRGDKYSDFKFLTMYAYQGDLYVYFYCENGYLYDGVEFTYSTSTTVSEDETSMVEDYQTVALDIMSTNGDFYSFWKCKATSFYTYNVGDQHRVYAESIALKKSEPELRIERECEGAEYSFQDNADGEDQIYTYYKDNYLLVSGAKCVMQDITTEWSSPGDGYASEIRENFWIFFDWDYSSLGYEYTFGKLKEVNLSYEYATYEVSYRIDGNNRAAYRGLYEKPDSFVTTMGNNIRDINFDLQNTERKISTITPSEKVIDEVTYNKTIFFFWHITKSINYKYNSIQKLDAASVNEIEDEDYKYFINSFREDYRYAVCFKEDTRTLVSSDWDFWNVGDFFMQTVKNVTKCHEPSSVTLLSLTFEGENEDLNLNAIMDPVDTSEAIETIPETTTVVTFMGVNTDTISRSIWITIGVILAIVLVGLIIYAYVKSAPLRAIARNSKKKK